MEEFYSRVLPWAALPVAVTSEGSYANYYQIDRKEIVDLVMMNITWLSKLPRVGKLVVLGVGENKQYLENLDGYPFGYNEVIYLPHPRWIMQYNRKKLDQYIAAYGAALTP